MEAAGPVYRWLNSPIAISFVGAIFLAVLSNSWEAQKSANQLKHETLIVFAGEFGRTTFCQGKLTPTNYGRDHHPRCFSVWMAGGGIKGGISYGRTDEFSYNIVENPVHIRDLNATILHQLGINHERLVFPFRGLDQRLTGVEESHVIKDILS